VGRRLILTAAGLSACGTISVEMPFLSHLAGTSEWQRVSVLSLGLGIVIVSAITTFVRRHNISRASACLIALDAAYSANAALCLVVYSAATGSVWSKSGWLVIVVIVWPIVLELVWLLIQPLDSSPD